MMTPYFRLSPGAVSTGQLLAQKTIGIGIKHPKSPPMEADIHSGMLASHRRDEKPLMYVV